MRALALALALLALAGCRSSRERPDRDYTSANREGVDFLFDTFREGNRLRKQNLKQDLAFSQRAAGNRRVRKQGIEFAAQSFWAEEWSGASQILHAPAVEKKGWKERLHSMRFGFLDSGD